MSHHQVNGRRAPGAALEPWDPTLSVSRETLPPGCGVVHTEPSSIGHLREGTHGAAGRREIRSPNTAHSAVHAKHRVHKPVSRPTGSVARHPQKARDEPCRRDGVKVTFASKSPFRSSSADDDRTYRALRKALRLCYPSRERDANPSRQGRAQTAEAPLKTLTRTTVADGARETNLYQSASSMPRASGPFGP